MIDWKKFNWPEIFGTIHAVAPLMSQNQFRFLAVDIHERTTAKYSGGQLKYVGNTENGKDFIGCDGLRYESKLNKNLIQPTITRTTPITLKNYQGRCLGVPEQTFDYMLAWDYTLNTVLLADWDHCLSDYTVEDSGLKIRLDERYCEVIAQNVIPVNKSPDDIVQKYNDFADSCG
jgi:hypothetical protein